MRLSRFIQAEHLSPTYVIERAKSCWEELSYDTVADLLVELEGRESQYATEAADLLKRMSSKSITPFEVLRALFSISYVYRQPLQKIYNTVIKRMESIRSTRHDDVGIPLTTNFNHSVGAILVYDEVEPVAEQLAIKREASAKILFEVFDNSKTMTTSVRLIYGGDIVWNRNGTYKVSRLTADPFTPSEQLPRAVCLRVQRAGERSIYTINASGGHQKVS